MPSRKKIPLPPPPQFGDCLQNILLLVVTAGIVVLIILSSDVLRNHAVSGINRFSMNVIKSPGLENQVPTSPLAGVIKWSASGSRLKPNTCQTFDGSWVKLPATEVCINSAGFRDYEYSQEKPDTVFRILMLGDSFTFGWGVGLNNTVPKKLEQLLNTGDLRVEVLNFGVPAHGTIEEIGFLEEVGIDHNPDLVLFLFEPDDFRNWTRYGPILENLKVNYIANHPSVSYEEAEAMVISSAFERLTDLEANESINSLSLRINPYLEKLTALSLDKNFTVIFVIEQNCLQNQKLFLESASARFDFSMFYVDGSEHPDYDPLKWSLHPLDAHPTPLANRVKAELIAGELQKRIPELSS